LPIPLGVVVPRHAVEGADRRDADHRDRNGGGERRTTGGDRQEPVPRHLEPSLSSHSRRISTTALERVRCRPDIRERCIRNHSAFRRQASRSGNRIVNKPALVVTALLLAAVTAAAAVALFLRAFRDPSGTQLVCVEEAGAFEVLAAALAAPGDSPWWRAWW
jgi:hypothetical protein